MTDFEKFFQISLNHDYYDDQRPPINFAPDLATQNLVTRQDLRFRQSGGGADCFASTDREVLELLAAQETEKKNEELALKITALKLKMSSVPDAMTKLSALELALSNLLGADDVLRFTFRLQSENSSLLAVTEHLADAARRIAVLDLRVSDNDEQTNERLLNKNDLRPLEVDEFAVDDFITAHDLISPPLAILRLSLAPTSINRRIKIRFRAVKRFLIFHILGGNEDAKYNIQDRTGEIKFNPVKTPIRPNGQLARSFRSNLPISEQARPAARFDLFRDGPHEPIPVVSPLPSPQAGPGIRDGADMASEIFVNLW